MLPINVIRDAALEALDDSEDDRPEALAAFHNVADPRTILELLELAEKSASGDEVSALLRDMAIYIEKVPDLDGAASPLEQRALLTRFRQLRDNL